MLNQKTRPRCLRVGALSLLFLVLTAPFARAETDAAILERGKYLVEQVGMCGDCHSPRNERGEFVEGKHLMGAPVDFSPNHPMPAWALVAPRIAGLPNLSRAQAIEVLSTGKGRPAGPMRPPMPGYRFSPDDAKAVVAYLKSLKH